ncbi:MAG: hypothetical protein IT193_10575 [Propionibacteriaceae bacterium]|nr:hypothetical protein [Propionibacteriaceae bacterium]
MQTRIAALGCAALLALGGCTQPGQPSAPPVPTSTGTAVPATTASPSAGSSTDPGATPAATTPGAPQPSAELPVLTLAGDAIGNRPLGTTPFGRVESLVEARLGKSEVGRPRLCTLTGERSPLSVVDHSWSGLVIHTGRRGSVELVIGWSVDLARVPDGFRLAGRLPWQPTFAELEKSAEVSVRDGVRTARLQDAAITYSGPADAATPAMVVGGPGFTCS